MNENKNESKAEPGQPDILAVTERVVGTVRSHQKKMRVLAGATFAIGFLAIITSIVFVWSYQGHYLPTHKQLMLEIEYPALKKTVDSAAEPPAIEAAIKRIDGMLGATVQWTHVIVVGVTLLCLAVGMLGLGTVVLMTLVILQRRMTLNQISASLAQISSQLKELQQPGSPA